MRATLTAKTIRHYDENGYVAYLEVVGGVGGKLSCIRSIGDRQYKNLSAICDRELARVGLADSKVPRPNIGDTFKRDGKTVTIRFVGQYDDYGNFWRVKIEGDNNWVNYPSRD